MRKRLFIKHIHFLKNFQRKLEGTSAEEATSILPHLDPSIQKNIMNFIPSMQENVELQEWKNLLIRKLKEKSSIIDKSRQIY